MTEYVDDHWKEYWIGLNDRHSEGTFVWESGRPLSADIAGKWKSGEPDDKWGSDCAKIVSTQNLMYDAMCGKKIGFVCQKRTSWSELWTELYAYVEELV